MTEASYTDIEIDAMEARLLFRESKESFLEYYLQNIIAADEAVQDFQLVTFDRFTDLSHPRDVIALPRDHAKTTYLRLAFVYMIQYTDLNFFVYMSSTATAAAASIQVIWDYLTDDPAVELFGKPKVIKERLSEGYLEFWYHCLHETKDEDGNSVFTMKRKLVILKGQGGRQAVRGMNIYNLRPQYVGIDDVEKEEDVNTYEGFLRFKAWFDNTFMRAVSREPGRNKVAQIGNLITKDSLLNLNIESARWRSMRFGVLRRDGTPLWPKRFPLSEIRLDILDAKARGELGRWFNEMMNMIINIETSLIDVDKIVYTQLRHPAQAHEYKTFITIDPAISQKESADDAAIVLHTLDNLGIPQVTDYRFGKLGVEGIASAVLELCQIWNCNVVGCESVQLQAVLLDYLQIALKMDGLYDINLVPIKVGRAHKTARLKTWAAALVAGEYTLPVTDWAMVHQLSQFDVRRDNNKDDLIDAGSMGLYMLNEYIDLIMANRVGNQKVLPPAIGSTTSM